MSGANPERKTVSSNESYLGAPWQPSDETVVSRDSSGVALSRFKDSRWDLSPYFDRAWSVNFGDAPGKGLKLSNENARLLRLVMAWWMIGPYKSSISAAVYKFEQLKPLLSLLSERDISGERLNDHPDLIPDIAQRYSGRISRLSSVLIDLLRNSDHLGFTILDAKHIEKLSSSDVEQSVRQTPYIPERIWIYQYTQILTCISDFLNIRSEVAELYRFALDAYYTNLNALGLSASDKVTPNEPFAPNRPPSVQPDGRVFHGDFSHVCDRFGISDAISKWVTGSKPPSIRSFKAYLTLINRAGLAFILNVSLMRANEATMLRKSCLQEERLPSGETIYILRGRTSKTIQEEDAAWIVPETAKLAVMAMSFIADLRLEAALRDRDIELDSSEKADPLLFSRSLEPWSPTSHRKSSSRKYLHARSYQETLKAFPRLLDRDELRICDADLKIARRISPDLDPDTFSVGKVWPLGWHQLRRTGAVNMLSSGLVSESTLQYQLKHASRVTTLYYGSNFSRVHQHFDNPARRFYENEAYAATARNFEMLHSNRFVSPHGEKRKEQILSLVASSDHDALLGLAREGKVSYRETLIGACVKTGQPCPYGGVTDTSRCMGFETLSPCPDAILDRSRLTALKRLSHSLRKRLSAIDESAPLFASLGAQLESIERAIGAIEDEQ